MKKCSTALESRVVWGCLLGISANLNIPAKAPFMLRSSHQIYVDFGGLSQRCAVLGGVICGGAAASSKLGHVRYQESRHL